MIEKLIGTYNFSVFCVDGGEAARTRDCHNIGYVITEYKLLSLQKV